MLTTHEAASYLRLSARTLERLRVTGTGPKFVRIGKSIRYQPSALEAYIAARVRSSTSEKDAQHG